MEKCKKMIFKGFHHYQCSRHATKDGYCKQHHPDSIKKRREESDRRYEKAKKNFTWYRLEVANKRIQELETVLKDMIIYLDNNGKETDVSESARAVISKSV